MNSPVNPPLLADPALAANPLLAPWHTPYGLPPFQAIRAEHFGPAFEVACQRQRAEVDAIASAAAPADFDNTIAAFDRCGRDLQRVEGVFYNLASSETSPALQAVERDLAPLLAAHTNAIFMHRGLFARIDAVHARRDPLALAPEALRLVERVHLDFVRAGAQLEAPAQGR